MTTEQRGKWCRRRPRTLRATSSETGWEGASPGGCGGSTALLTPGPQASRTARGFLPHLALLTVFVCLCLHLFHHWVSASLPLNQAFQAESEGGLHPNTGLSGFPSAPPRSMVLSNPENLLRPTLDFSASARRYFRSSVGI